MKNAVHWSVDAIPHAPAVRICLSSLNPPKA
jgi:hypothetical protein